MKDLWSRLFKRSQKTEFSDRESFSQSGEDTIIDFLLAVIGEPAVSYLDLGANDPVKFSNTYRFYRKGHRGLLVEPDPTMASRISSCRPRDECIAKAITVDNASEVEFFRMSSDTLSTTKKSTAERYVEETEHHLNTSFTVPAINVNELLNKYFQSMAINFVSIDVEGMDSDIVEAWDFARYRPPVFCIETLTYTQNGIAERVEGVFQRMDEVGYKIYADTYINTIFVDAARLLPAERHLSY